jgi:hypothetical protein
MDARSDDVIRIGSLELRFLVDEIRAAGSVVVFEFVVPPNARVPAPHYHREVDEMVASTSFAVGKAYSCRAEACTTMKISTRRRRGL